MHQNSQFNQTQFNQTLRSHPLKLINRRTFLFGSGMVLARSVTLPFQLTPPINVSLASQPSPLPVERITVAGGVPLYRTMVDLQDPEVFLSIGLANNATQANSSQFSAGDEAFSSLIRRYPAAALLTGTFFSKDAQKRVMGNMVAAGRFLKYSQWENYGTTLGIRADKRLEMRTARVEGKPEWDKHWFSLTCGPRLLKQGQVWISPKSEGFSDPHVLGVGARTAVGFPKSANKLVFATFLKPLSLQAEANAMKALGCYEAMNLDGGASVALAHRGKVLVEAGRRLTNLVVVYDVNHPAPQAVKEAWRRFQGEGKAIA